MVTGREHMPSNSEIICTFQASAKEHHSISLELPTQVSLPFFNQQDSVAHIGTGLYDAGQYQSLLRFERKMCTLYEIYCTATFDRFSVFNTMIGCIINF